MEGLELKGKRDEAGEGTITLWFFEACQCEKRKGKGRVAPLGRLMGDTLLFMRLSRKCSRRDWREVIRQISNYFFAGFLLNLNMEGKTGLHKKNAIT